MKQEITDAINTLRQLLQNEHGFSREDAFRAAWNHFLPNVPLDEFIEGVAKELK